jgi:hypothetical protein
MGLQTIEQGGSTTLALFANYYEVRDNEDEFAGRVVRMKIMCTGMQFSSQNRNRIHRFYVSGVDVKIKLRDLHEIGYDC